MCAEVPLYEETYWKKVLHFKNGESRIASKEFFLSTKSNPSLSEELNATLNGLNRSDGQHIACRFPARYEWLKSKTNLPTYDLSQCVELQSFEAEFPKYEVDIAYKVADIDSAAGAFGHNYLVFKDQNSSYDSSLAIDLIAKTDHTNFLSYAHKGFNGDYNATYNKSIFYKELNAVIGKNRSFHMYKLNLSQNEIKTLIYHLYELKNIELRYYYLNGNCTSYLDDLLSLVHDDSKDDSHVIYAPSDITKIYGDKITKTSSITLDDYRYKYFKGLSEDEKKRYLKVRTLQDNYNAVKDINWTDYDNTSKPIINDPSKLSLGAFNRKDVNGYTMTYSYYNKSIQDRYKKFEQRADLSLLRLGVEIEKENVKLNQFYLVDFNKYSFDETSSIHLSSGLNRENHDYVLHYENEIGAGIPFRYKNMVTYLVLNGGLENTDFYLKPKIMAFYELNEDHKIGINYYHKFIGSEFYQTDLEYKSKMGDLTLMGKYIKTNGQEGNKVSLSIEYYF